MKILRFKIQWSEWGYPFSKAIALDGEQYIAPRCCKVADLALQTISFRACCVFGFLAFFLALFGQFDYDESVTERLLKNILVAIRF